MISHRPTRAEIDLAALIHNLREIRRQAGAMRSVLALVKADAYGHGAVPVARALEAEGVDMFGVALAEEGVALRAAGIQTPILVLGRVFPGQEEAFFTHRLTPCLFDLESARRLQAEAKQRAATLDVHIEIDTGMARVGFSADDLENVLQALRACDRLRIEGILSHFAVADEPDNPFTDTQINGFTEILALIEAHGPLPRHVHLSNSAAIFSRDIPACNLVRPGIALYGALPSAHFTGLDLRPVMRLVTEVALIRDIPAGCGVSYGHRFVTARPSRIAALPIGYADGYNRLLTNRGEVLVRGLRAPVAGTVCMDWTMVDVTDVPGVEVGDEVTLLGPGPGGCISAEEWAQEVNSISYEIFCRIGPRVPRIYTREKGVSA